MGGVKVFVLRLKDVIRTGLFVLAGLVLIMVLVWALLPKKQTAAALYTPGVYVAQIVLHSKPVNVEVTVSEDAITKLELTGMAASQASFYPLFAPTMDRLAREVLAAQDTNIESPVDSAVTSEILLRAIRAALAQAMN